MTTPEPRATAWRPRLGTAFWIGTALSAAFLLIGITSGGLSGFLIVAGLIALVTAVFTAVTGRGGWLALPGRKIALGLLVTAIVVTGAGGAVAGTGGDVSAPNDRRAIVAVEDTPTPSPTPTPEIEKRDVAEDAAIPFGAVTVDDPNALVGSSIVTVAGAPGVQTTTYRVTYVDGVETARSLLTQVTTVAPVDTVTAIGSKPIPVAKPAPAAPVAPAPVAAAPGGCDPNYSGQCVPIASDVDCAGGSGNGPAYTPGPVTIVGSDIYDLDRDGDGIACDA